MTDERQAAPSTVTVSREVAEELERATGLLTFAQCGFSNEFVAARQALKAALSATPPPAPSDSLTSLLDQIEPMLLRLATIPNAEYEAILPRLHAIFDKMDEAQNLVAASGEPAQAKE